MVKLPNIFLCLEEQDKEISFFIHPYSGSAIYSGAF